MTRISSQKAKIKNTLKNSNTVSNFLQIKRSLTISSVTLASFQTLCVIKTSVTEGQSFPILLLLFNSHELLPFLPAWHGWAVRSPSAARCGRYRVTGWKGPGPRIVPWGGPPPVSETYSQLYLGEINFYHVGPFYIRAWFLGPLMLPSVILSTFFLHLNGRREEGSWLTGTSVSLTGAAVRESTPRGSLKMLVLNILKRSIFFFISSLETFRAVLCWGTWGTVARVHCCLGSQAASDVSLAWLFFIRSLITTMLVSTHLMRWTSSTSQRGKLA